MRINRLSSYYTLRNNYPKQSGINKNIKTTSPISFGDVEFYDYYGEYIKAINSKEGQMRQKSAGINGMVQNGNMMYNDTKKVGKYIYGRLKRAIDTGKKVNFESYRARGKVNDINAMLDYGELSENGLPKSIIFIEPRMGKCLLEYELSDNGTSNYTVKDYMQNRKLEYEMSEDKIVSVTERGGIHNTEKQLMPYKNGYHFVISRVSQDGKTAEPIKSLEVSNDKKNPYKKYVEFNGNESVTYNHNPETNLWTKE